MGHIARMAGLFALFCAGHLAASGCGTILGIEELKPGPDGGSAGPGGASGASGAGTSGGTTSASGGTTSASGGATGGGISGSGGDSGSSGAGGATVGDGGGPITVQGTLIDFWRHRVPSIVVHLTSSAGSASATTDGNGQFSLPNVAVPYDVSFVVNTSGSGGTVVHGWVFKGLRRTNPTLQVYRGLPARSGTIDINLSNTFTFDTTNAIAVAVGGADGAFEVGVDNPQGVTYLSAAWNGPATTSATANALAWKHVAGGWPTDTTTGFISYDSRVVALSETTPGSVTFDLTAKTVPSGSISGTVTSNDSDRQNDVYIHYTSGATIQLASLGVSTADFTYIVPTIADASIAFAAQSGTISRPPFAVAHQDGLVAGQTGIKLTIPTPATLLEPSSGVSNTGTGIVFKWTGGSNVSVWHLSSVNFYEDMFVVTADKETQIPTFAGSGFTVAKGQPYTWSVENHGNYASTDDATGANGFLDACSRDGQVVGPRRDSGTFTDSERRGLTP